MFTPQTNYFIKPSSILLVACIFSFSVQAREIDFTLKATSSDTTKTAVNQQIGSNIEVNRDFKDIKNFTIVATESIDLVGDFNTVSGNLFDARIGNVVAETPVYAIPDYGTGMAQLDHTGKIIRSSINLKLDADEQGNVLLKDLSYNERLYSFDKKGDIKRYMIGFANKYEVSTTSFSVEQMQEGINVNAYKGREITITAYLIDKNDEWIGTNPVQQTIFIPDNQYTPTKKVANKTYFYAPESRFYEKSQVPYYEKYGKPLQLSAGESFASLATTFSEAQKPTWYKLNVTGTESPEVETSTRFSLDHFVELINSNGVPHPKPYQMNAFGQLDIDAWVRWFDAAFAAHGNDPVVFRSAVLGAFASDYTNPFGKQHKILFINNEIWNFWEKSGEKGLMFESWVRDAYARHQDQTGNDILPWHRRVYNYNDNIADIGRADAEEVIKGTYNELMFDSQGDFKNFKNWAGKYGSFSHEGMAEWGANLNDFGNYVNNLYCYNYVYDFIYHGLLFQRHPFPKKPVYVIWHDVEPLGDEFRQSNSWVKFKDKVYRIPTKQIVGPEIMFSVGAAVAFFNKPGNANLYVWSEAVWANKEEATMLYPVEAAVELTSSGEKPSSLPPGFVFYPAKPITFVNQAFDAFSIVKDHKTILENSEVEVADVKVNNNWVSDVNKYPYAAAYYRHPFVAYRKYKNELLVFAYAWYNHEVTETTFRTAEGKEYTVELKGCYPSIVKITE